jgi:hypothetical protein
MARQRKRPTPRQLVMLRQLHAAAGSKANLLEWLRIAEATPCKASGRPKGEKYPDEDLLVTLQTFVEVAARDRGWKPTRTLKWFASALLKSKSGTGKPLSEEDRAALVQKILGKRAWERWRKKLKAGNVSAAALPHSTAVLVLDPEQPLLKYRRRDPGT